MGKVKELQIEMHNRLWLFHQMNLLKRSCHGVRLLHARCPKHSTIPDKVAKLLDKFQPILADLKAQERPRTLRLIMQLVDANRTLLAVGRERKCHAKRFITQMRVILAIGKQLRLR